MLNVKGDLYGFGLFFSDQNPYPAPGKTHPNPQPCSNERIFDIKIIWFVFSWSKFWVDNTSFYNPNI